MLSENITRYRNILNLTRKEFTEKTGISKSFLRNVELGKSILSAEKYIDVCKKLDLPMDYFIGDDTRFGQIMSIYIFIEYLNQHCDREVRDAIANIFTIASDNE